MTIFIYQLILRMIMGRPRKEPRRVITFNISTTIADRIDALQLSNRSEWGAKVFKDYLDNGDATKEAHDERAALIADPASRIDKIDDETIYDEAERRGITRDRFSTKRLLLLTRNAVAEDHPHKKRLIQDLDRLFGEI